jgi:mannose-6-phosphate isomerase
MELYPLKFKTIFKDKLWGGQKIKTILGKDFGDLPNCGETWEISGVPGNVSVVADGALAGQTLNELIIEYGSQLLGDKVHARFGNEFPLLVKFIDANDDLSIQVHPDDKLANARHDSFGKTEMWYIFQADPGSKLIAGFNKPLTKQEYLEYFNAGKLMDILNQEEAAADDVFFLPAGRVHTIGKGLLLAEIQQTSDVTYRIYDFDRTDDQGNKRELHVEEALDAIDYQHYPEYKTRYVNKKNAAVSLVECEYFNTKKLDFDQSTSRDYSNVDSFKILVCMEGTAVVKVAGASFPIGKGEAMLIPATLKSIDLETEAGFKMLESYIA